MGPRQLVGVVEVVTVLGLHQRLVAEGVEDELAGEAQVVDRLRPVVAAKGAQSRLVLAQEDVLFSAGAAGVTSAAVGLASA